MQRDEAATALGRICQERDEARAQLDEARGMAGADAAERWYLRNLQAQNVAVLRERDDARAQVKAWEASAIVCKEIERERDEARAIARRLAAELRHRWVVGAHESYTTTQDALCAFDALPWAQEPSA